MKICLFVVLFNLTFTFVFILCENFYNLFDYFLVPLGASETATPNACVWRGEDSSCAAGTWNGSNLTHTGFRLLFFQMQSFVTKLDQEFVHFESEAQSNQFKFIFLSFLSFWGLIYFVCCILIYSFFFVFTWCVTTKTVNFGHLLVSRSIRMKNFYHIVFCCLCFVNFFYLNILFW